MAIQNTAVTYRPRIRGPITGASLRQRADDLLVSIATVGLLASVADGEPDVREIDCFVAALMRQFALSRSRAIKVVSRALVAIRSIGPERQLECAFDTLNAHLSVSQKLALFDLSAEILLADRTVIEGERLFLDYLVVRLRLSDALAERVWELEEEGGDTRRSVSAHTEAGSHARGTPDGGVVDQ